MAYRGDSFTKDLQYIKFCMYGFFKNLRFFEPFLVLFLLESGQSYLQIGFLYSIREGACYLMEIPTGMLSDSLGRRKTMIASFSFYILSFLLFFIGNTYFVFVLAMLVYALGEAFRTGTHKAMIFDYLKIKGWEKQKVSYYGHTRSWSQMGSAVSALLAAGFVFYTGNYRAIFLFAIIPYLAELFLLASYPKELDGHIADMNQKSSLDGMKKVWKDFIDSFRQAELMRSLANLSVFTGYYKAAKDYLQLLIQSLALGLPFLIGFKDKQRTAVLVGIVYFIIFLITSISARNSGRITNRFKSLAQSMNLTLLFGLLAGAIAGLMYSREWMAGAVLFFVLIFIVENIRKPAGIAYITETGNTDILATLLSAESQANTLVTIILAPVLGWLADLWGIGISLSIVSIAIILTIPFYRLRGQSIK